MSETNELQKLEEFVGKLLQEYKALKVNLASTKEQLAEKILVIEELNEQVAMQQLDRDDVTERVNRIVGQFEDWERDVAEEELMDEIAQEEKATQSSEAIALGADQGSSY